MKTYHGSCHCQAIKYTVKLNLDEGVMECNCSHCERKGFLLSMTPKTNFSLTQGEELLSEYRFNKHAIAHLFCKNCGVQCFGFGEKDGTEMVAVNIRTLDDIDIHDIKKFPVDGKKF